MPVSMISLAKWVSDDLVWEQFDDTLRLILVDTGSHSDLFG